MPEFKPEWILRKSNEQYDVWDCKIASHIISVTYLKVGQKTNGHKHPHKEMYIPITDNKNKGQYQLSIGALTYKVDADAEYYSTYNITGNNFHQIDNTTDKPIVMMCIFDEAK